jgi:hypothetical protein
MPTPLRPQSRGPLIDPHDLNFWVRQDAIRTAERQAVETEALHKTKGEYEPKITALRRRLHPLSPLKSAIAMFKTKYSPISVEDICRRLDKKVEGRGGRRFEPRREWIELANDGRAWLDLLKHPTIHNLVKSFIDKVKPNATRAKR